MRGVGRGGERVRTGDNRAGKKLLCEMSDCEENQKQNSVLHTILQ